MKDRTNDQPGAQRHPEGGYGDVAREANKERLETPRDDDDDVIHRSTEGRRRIHEDREQHDEADKNSEKNRLTRERNRGSAD